MESLSKKLKLMLTPEKKEALKKRRENQIKSMTLEYQLGYYIGEYITHQHMPTLSTDIQSRKCIEVSEEDTTEHERLSNAWLKKLRANNDNKKAAKDEWNEYIAFRKAIKKKYLPETLEVFIQPLNVENETELKKGIRASLWNSDICGYRIETDEDIVIEHTEDIWFTVIKLKLDIEG